MRKLASAAIATALAGMMAVPAPASAATMSFSYGNQGKYVNNYCSKNWSKPGCNDWQKNGKNWGKNDYQNWYRWNRPSLGGSVAAGIFGFAVGAAIANSVNNGNSSSYDAHVARCEARFRSYDEETDMYRGFDGEWHRCRL